VIATTLAASPLPACLALALSCALVSGCDSKKSAQPADPSASIAAPSTRPPADGDDVHGHEPGPRRPAGPPALALTPRVRSDLTTISVSARVGNVVIRKEGNTWLMRGRDGCSVPLPRIERALDNLAQLRAVATNDPVPEGTAFQLQISLLIGEERALHLEVADRHADGDAARLDNDSMVRVQGLDRGLWSPHPPDWCRAP
jgi:hypothetical protein